MKHTTDYIVLFYQDDNDWETISIFERNDRESLKEQVTIQMNEWDYNINELNTLIDNIVEDLYNDNYYEDDMFKFKTELVAFYK
jgi:hypothetical protein